MLEVGDGESNNQTEVNEAFQQEAISDVEDNVQYCKGGIEVENIPEGLREQGDNNKDEVHYIPDSDMDPDKDYDN